MVKAFKNVNEHAYLSIPDNSEDDVSYGRNLDMLTSELAKPMGREKTEVLKTLMNRTFPQRRQWVLDSSDTKSVSEIASKFPLLKKAAYVSIIYYCKRCVPHILFFAQGSLEFSLIAQKPNIREAFESSMLD